jgi:peroxiredoxin
VQFDGLRSINRVTVYTLNSEKYPAGRHGIKEAWLQLWKEHGWSTVGEIKDGAIASRVNLERRPAGGKMVFKFDHSETEKIRLVVFRSNDIETVGQGWRDDRKSEKSVARVVEIQATGLGKISDKESIRAKRVKEAPEFTLQDLNGEWVRLSNFRGKVVIATFWAAWSSQSTRQIRDLNKLHEQYKDQDVVVIGISVDEGGAERIKSFIQGSSLEYTILLADTSTKLAYGGIGKLPSTFVIDQEGCIYREYFQYRNSHVLELDIKKLLSRNQ